MCVAQIHTVSKGRVCDGGVRGVGHICQVARFIFREIPRVQIDGVASVDIPVYGITNIRCPESSYVVSKGWPRRMRRSGGCPDQTYL